MADAPTPASETPPPRTTGGGFRWEPPTAAELQATMPGYTIEKILGRGGMGAVYKGVQLNLDRTVAIKILPPGVEQEDPSFAERFKNEAKLMAKLMHGGIVAVHDFGSTTAGQLYFAMEFVDGSDVAQLLKEQGRLPPEHALAILMHMCEALGAAHEQGITHRDIKPANVLINTKGQVKIADLGLAKIEEAGSHGLTKTGYAMGTPDFVSPEALLLGSAIDGRADIYAMGVMLYQLLTGNVPRGAFKPASVLRPTLDPRYDAIILKAMQHDREERYQSTAALRRDLDVIHTVPFVPQAAPAAQAPAQPPAAQKPLGKAPQPKSTTGTPARQEAAPAGRSAHGTSPAAKSNTPLFLGLGAAAVIAIGAFIMFSGGKVVAPKSSPVASGASAPLKAGAAAKLSASPAPSKKPDPAKWQPLFPDSWLNSGALVLPDGKSLVSPLNVAFHNGAVSLVLRRNELAKELIVRVRDEKSTRYALQLGTHGLGNLRLLRGNTSEAGGDFDLPSFDSRKEYQIEFVAVEDVLAVFINGLQVAALKDAAQRQGGVSFFGEGTRIRNVRWQSFDGEQAVATTAPVSQFSDKFPPGQWVNITADVLRDNSHLLSMPDGWIKYAHSPNSYKRPAISSSNLATRLRLRWGGSTAKQDFALDLSGFSVVMKFSVDRTTGAGMWLQGLGGRASTQMMAKRTPIEQTNELSLEYAHVGSTLVARVNGQMLRAELPQDLVHERTTPTIYSATSNAFIRDIEVINLDGLSEAEALKILGVDAQGNDLRAKPSATTPPAMAATKSAVPAAPVSPSPPLPDSKSSVSTAPISASSPTLPPELAILDATFIKLQAERVTAPFETDLAKLHSGYLGGIAKKIAEEKAAGHLDGILALEAEQTRITAKQSVPDTDEEKTPASLKALRGIYRDAHAKLTATRATNLKALTDPLDKRLAQMESDFAKSDRLADAKTVRGYREVLAEGRAAGPPAAASVATATNAPNPALGGPSALPGALTPAATLALKDGITNTLGMKFLPVKGTAVMFCIHEVRYSDYAAYAAESPGVDGSWKDQTCDGYALTENKENHPVMKVSWEDAQKFCAWLSKKEGKTYRLPTDQEWSYAVGIGRDEKWKKDTTPATVFKSQTDFPWGDKWPPPKSSGNYSDESRKAKAPNGAAQYLEDYDDGFPTTAPVMSFKPNKLGLYDLEGNVREWVEDWYDNAQKDRVLRGGSWYHHDRGSLLSSYRNHYVPGRRINHDGFRCVLVVSGG